MSRAFAAFSMSFLALMLFTAAAVPVQAQAKDVRLGKTKDYNGNFPWTPPTSVGDWLKRRQEVKEQVLIATGLWPMPDRTPIKAVIHGKIHRKGYTIEKVFFASYPGHYVTGNLYRPAAGGNGKLPGILCPHGHWPNGRFYEASDEEAKAQMKQGAERTMEGARYPLQARCAQLARMGCVVFHYDMVGYADSKQIQHRGGFTDAEAELRLQSFMGLQTFNSIRALDFLLSLPEIDPKRIGVTGASGGGTQTFILCAVDNRPAVAFPAVMVSTKMQGGCICENCSYLRQGTGNIELAGLFAPKPLGMSGANDWTLEIESKGLPELKSLYALLGAPHNVIARCFPQFGHNYNQVSREVMYNFFNKHLGLGQMAPVTEAPFVPVPPAQLSVFDTDHPLPKDAVTAAGLRQYLTSQSESQLTRHFPSDAKKLAEFRKVVGTALRVMIMDGPLGAERLHGKDLVAGSPQDSSKLQIRKLDLGRPGSGEHVPALFVSQGEPNRVVVWVHPAGLASLWDQEHKLVPAAQRVLGRNAALLTVEVLRTGKTAAQTAMPINAQYAGYTFGYNRPLLANRVHDIISAVDLARDLSATGRVDLIGFNQAGPWVALARGLCGNNVDKTVADLDQFSFANVSRLDDEMMLPGALKYGGLHALAALAAPHELYLHNMIMEIRPDWLYSAYTAAGSPGNLHRRPDKVDALQAVNWLFEP